ncbi:MAG: DMT family transporter [Candidatus Thorarchaeota archaeon]|jgi:DME family drug/metabolite transporter
MQLTPDLLLGVAIGLFTALLWGISTNVYKSQSDDATPIAISALKMWFAFIFMVFLLLLPFKTTPFYMPFESLVFLVASVTIGLVAGDLVYLTAQERIGVAYAFPITNIYPITTYIIAIFLVSEAIIPVRFLGISIAIVGISLISQEQGNEEGETKKKDLIGIGLAICAALCWSVGSVFLQIGVTGIDPIDANFVRMMFGSAILIPIVLGAKKRGMPTPPRRSSKIIIAGGFLGMSLGALLYTYSVDLIGASVAALLGSTAPLFAIPISILILKEKYTAKSLLGALLAVLGVVLVVMAV